MRDEKGRFLKGNVPHNLDSITGNDCIALSDNRIGIILNHRQIAIICSFDYHLIKDYTWYAHWDDKIESYYVKSTVKLENGKHKDIFMHRLIIGSNKRVDHINHNTVDNTRENLRFATGSQNGGNRKVSKNNQLEIKNIHLNEYGNYRVEINKNGQRVADKTFKTLNEARAYKHEMLFIEKVHGEFACDG